MRRFVYLVVVVCGRVSVLLFVCDSNSRPLITHHHQSSQAQSINLKKTTHLSSPSKIPTLVWNTGDVLPCMTPHGARTTSPPKTSPMHWWPMQTPKRGKSGPSSRTACSEMPESTGRPLFVCCCFGCFCLVVCVQLLFVFSCCLCFGAGGRWGKGARGALLVFLLRVGEKEGQSRGRE